jgi:hypothetical protein
MEVRQHHIIFHMPVLSSIIIGTSSSTIIIVEPWSRCVLDGLHAGLHISAHVCVIVGTRLSEFGFNPVGIRARD